MPPIGIMQSTAIYCICISIGDIGYRPEEARKDREARSAFGFGSWACESVRAKQTRLPALGLLPLEF
jgi:hypothetical protein